MIAGQAVNSFKLVGCITEKILMLIEYGKGHNISRQHQYITHRLQRMLL